MPEDGMTPISRAVARMLAETRHTPEFRQWMREWEQLKQAAKAEESAGIRYGLAWEALEWFGTSTQAMIEITQPSAPSRNPAWPPRPMRCYYCEGKTETENRLCVACKRYIQTILAGEVPEEPARYRCTITPYMRGDHLIRDKAGFVVGTRCPPEHEIEKN